MNENISKYHSHIRMSCSKFSNLAPQRNYHTTNKWKAGNQHIGGIDCRNVPLRKSIFDNVPTGQY